MRTPNATPILATLRRIPIDPNQRPWSLCWPDALPHDTAVGDWVAVELDESEPLTVGLAQVKSIRSVVRLATDWSSLREW